MPKPLLDYAILTHPEPLQASPPGLDPSFAKLQLLVSNGTNREIQVAKITLAIPIGPNAKDLTKNPSDIHTDAPEGWTVTSSGAVYSLQPDTPEAGRIGRGGLTFTLANAEVNDEQGVCELTIGEVTMETNDGKSTPRDATEQLPLAKWPPEFTVGDLGVEPAPPVAPGTNVNLYWTGSDQATYTLKYNDNSRTVPHTGSFVVDDLQESTVFYLDVQGQTGDKNQSLQRAAIIDVVRPTIVPGSFQAAPQPVDYGRPVTLAWRTENASSCTLTSDHQEFPLAANSDPAQPYQVTPQVESAYQLVANQGTLRSNSVLLPQINFNPPVIKTFAASAPAVDYGQAVKLNWDVVSTVSVLLNSQPVDSTSIEKKPTQKTTYTLTALGAGKESATAEQTVDVNVVSVSDAAGWADTSRVLIASFQWKASHATEVSLSGWIKMWFNTGRPPWSHSITEDNYPPSNQQYSYAIVPFGTSTSLLRTITKISGKLTITAKGPGPSGQASATAHFDQNVSAF